MLSSPLSRVLLHIYVHSKNITTLSFSSNYLLLHAVSADNLVSYAVETIEAIKNNFLIFSTLKHLVLHKDNDICWLMLNFLTFSVATSFLFMFLPFCNTAELEMNSI